MSRPTRSNSNFIDFEQILRELETVTLPTYTHKTNVTEQNHKMTGTSLSPPWSSPPFHRMTPMSLWLVIRKLFSQYVLPSMRIACIFWLEDLSCHVPNQLCQKIWSNQYINLALLLKGNVDLNDFCSGGILHISDKGQLISRP